MYEIEIANVLTPESYKKLNRVDIFYAFYKTRFGECLMGVYNDSLCYLSFKTKSEVGDRLSHLKQCFPDATFTENETTVRDFIDGLFENEKSKNIPVKVTLFGTEFQINVWKALIEIEEGTTVSYEDIAKSIGKPKAVRAAANAIGNNKIAYVIPCHRVIRKNGLYVGKYRWGVEKKKEMLEYEGVYNLK